ncbi:MAG TPA: hypothetical protein VJ761_23590 [Ktedonobacteraceae bacterium]|nr:hypothetical protein [Ktedonobacteraceae bacterium]
MTSITQLCFQGPARLCELAPEYPFANKELVANLLEWVVQELPFPVKIDKISIAYLCRQHAYMICAIFYLDTYAEEAETLLEGLVENGLLQIFSKVSFVDNPNF